jgi:hypothetical protein
MTGFSEMKNQQNPASFGLSRTASLGDALLRVECINAGLDGPFPALPCLPQNRLKRVMLESTAKGSMRSVSGVPEGTPGTAPATPDLSALLISNSMDSR